MPPRLCTTLPLPTTRTPLSRSGASFAPSSRWSSNGFVALIESCTTGMSASGNTWVSTDQVPWSMPQLSMSGPTQVGWAISATSAAISGAPGAG